MALYTRADYDRDLDELDRDDQMISRLIASGHMTGLESLRVSHGIEIRREMLKGRLFGTIMRLKDRDHGASCLSPAGHKPGCMCKNLARSIEADRVETEALSR